MNYLYNVDLVGAKSGKKLNKFQKFIYHATNWTLSFITRVSIIFVAALLVGCVIKICLTLFV